MSPPIEVGFYGKLPSHGDFLRRRVSDAFVRVWDGWLQECMTASRAALGDRWLEVYLESPAWRFGCAPGVFGAVPVVGLMVPSVDRVGRYFYLTLAAELPAGLSVMDVAMEGAAFFDRAERLVVETLGTEQVDFDGFDAGVLELGSELDALAARSRVVLEPGASSILEGTAQAAWQIPIGSAQQLGPAFAQVLGGRLTALYDPLVVWWSDGSSMVVPSCLVGRGLPHPDAFTALLDGSWTDRRWQPIRADVAPGPPAVETLVDERAPARFRSAAATDVGRVRSINQDSFLERTDVGLWAVADGLGGHNSGEVASRMVCDALADFVPGTSFEEMIEAASRRVHEVNDHLIRAANRLLDGGLSGSTVVALMARGSRLAVLWAGDSRLYRWRGGRLEQLTQDHSLAEAPGSSSTAITRAVGGDPTLVLDLYRDRVQPADRFLLCSDGLTRAVPEPRICEWLQHDDIRQAVDGLIKTTLDAGAPDNVTAVIVEACA